MMEMVVTTRAVRRAQLQSIVTTNEPTPSFIQAGCPSCNPINSVRTLKGESITFQGNANFKLIWTTLVMVMP